MKLVIALFTLTVLGTASFGIAAWTDHLGRHDASMRAIHYDTHYDMSAQRRHLAE